MKPYLLLTPGPLTTSETVKEAMMTDWCTWDEDYNLGIVQELRKDLVNIATKKPEEYTSILLQGSGTYCVEAVLGATITPKDKLLICSNGAYGDRMGNIAEYYHLDYDMLAFEETEQVSVEYVDDYLSNNSDITHVAFVHCETTTGILNPIKELSHIVKMHGKKLIVDCMSSFGGIPLRCKRTRYRLPNQQFQQVYSGCTGIRIHHRPPFGIKILQRSGTLSFPGHLRPMGNNGKGTRKMALHFTDTRCPCFQTSPDRID